MSKIDLLITALVAVGIIICYFLLVPPAGEIHQLQTELEGEQRRHEQLEEKVADYERQIEKIKRNDPDEVERIARDRLGFCREGEDVYQMELPETQQKMSSEEGLGAR